MAKLKHVLAIPFPAQGHVTPLLKLSHCIADHGVKVTFGTTEFAHAQMMAANQQSEGLNRIKFVAFPDGLETDEERKDWAKLLESIARVMPGHLQKFIEKVKQQSNGNEDEQISFVIADLNAGWALEVAERMGIERAGFWAASVSSLALTLHIPKLIEGGVIDNDGKGPVLGPLNSQSWEAFICDVLPPNCFIRGMALKNDVIPISKDLPLYKSDDLTWSFREDLMIQKILFRWALAIVRHSTRSTSYICNSFYELEASACGIIPGLLPVGPLLASTLLLHHRGSLWNEDSTCSNWLDQHPPQSVIYVAFGSTTIFSPEQFYELAHGLEQIRQPFLWVVHPDMTGGPVNKFLGPFLQRVRNHGKVVQWAPQEEVLAHPSVACFFTHCGWNSTLEGLSNGVPLLCKPYFADQHLNRTFICDVWRVGLGVDGDENGVITRHEVRTKMQAVLGNHEIRENCLRMKDMAKKSVSGGGSSLKNLDSFIELIKA